MNNITDFYTIFLHSTQSALEKFLAFIPNLLASFIIFIVGLLIAKLIKKISTKFFKWIGVDRISRKSGIESFLVSSGYKNSLVDIFSRILFWSTFLLFLLPISDILQLTFFADIINKVIIYLPNLIFALLILLFGVWAAKVISGMIKGATVRLGEGNSDFISSFINIIILIISFIISFSQLGIDISILTNILLLVIGISFLSFGIAFGFAAKNIIGNIISGIYLEKTVKPGNEISMNNITGKIIEIGSITSIIETEDGKKIKVSNNSIL